MEADPRAGILAALAELTDDLRAWAAWAEATGADGLPPDPDPAPLPNLMPLAPGADPPARGGGPGRPPAPGSTRTGPSAPSPTRTGPSSPGPGRSAPPVGPGPTVEGDARAPGRAAPHGRGAPPPAPAAGPTRLRSPESVAAAHDAMMKVRGDLGDCRRCRLAEGRRTLVFGVGDPDADLILIGEGPGAHEDRTGEPFVGRSGQLLTRMLGAIGLPRSDVYICNVVKCRPPNNRDPEPDEVAACSPFLHRQIEVVRPKVILTLGRFAARCVVGVDAPLGQLRRQVAAHREIPVVVTYHPSYLLRTPLMKREAWRDLIKVRDLLRR